jgi:hypothetical protein
VSIFGTSKERQLTERVDQALADDILSDDEQDKLFEFARSLGIVALRRGWMGIEPTQPALGLAPYCLL